MTTILQAVFLLAVLIFNPTGMAAAQSADRSTLPGVNGGDDRLMLESEDWPWTAIGRVNKQGTGFCTGALVEADRVLTAAHCLLNRATGRLHRPDFLTFVTGYSRGRYKAVSRVKGYQTPCSPVLPLPDRLAEMGCDIAMLELADPVGGIEPIPLEKRTGEPREAGSLLLAGYQQDRPYMLSVDKTCHLAKWLNERVFLHDCDGVKGASGAPLLTQEGGRFMVVGAYIGFVRRPAASINEAGGVAAVWPLSE